MRKLLLVGLLVLFTITVLSVEIVFWYPLSGTKGQVLKEIVERFDKAHPDIKVKLVYTGKYRETAQKVMSALVTKSLPNGGIIPAGPIFTGAYGNYKILEYMLYDPDFDISDFYDVAWDYAKYKGRICAIPYNISTPVLIYNKKLMEEAGLDPNRPPETWEELLEYAKKITKDLNGDGEPDVWGLNIKDTPWLFKAMLFQNDCEIIDADTMTPLFDGPKGVEAAAFWKKLIDEKAMPVGMHNLADKQFISGTLGFYMGSSSRIGKWCGKLPFEVGVAFLPKKVKRAIPIGGAVLVMFPHSKEEDDAMWKLIKWLVSPENLGEFCIKTGYIPIRESVLEVPEVKKFMEENPHYRVAFEQMKYGKAYWHFEQMGTMDYLLYEYLDKIERGILTPEEAMKEAAEKLKKEIENE
ncbi:ABC transporter substrate-binding protein [Kosmotoga sp.]|uniref:ABC transporter substrate-binding protein n=1 Tax=Kosmotoga sp. TaxID=1955248 RepID=UPI0024AAB8CB|nr:ABC transporter substrate-binding protein [Kosmotoga sp.]MDI3524449.1 sn-glycerol 3-phosphate transport system substrate-binding protein [Kosmotoga sp.]